VHQFDLRLIQELLRRDYAVGYVMLGWLLRCTWAITPAIGALLKLPQPAMAMATQQQLPALLAWLLQDADQRHKSQQSGNRRHAQEQQQQHQQQQVMEQLLPDKLKDLQKQLVGPTAAVASYASFAKAYQMLASAPVTPHQVSKALQ